MVVTRSGRPHSKAVHEPRSILKLSRLVAVTCKARRIFRQSQEPLEVPRRFAVFARCGGTDGNEDAYAEGMESTVQESAGGTSLAFSRRLGAPQVVSISSMALVLEEACTASTGSTSPQYFFGHSRPIELLEASDDGRWVASVQGSDAGEVSSGSACASPPLIRIWRASDEGLYCASTVSCPRMSSIRAVAFDAQARNFAAAGLDLHGRQNLMVWDSRKAGGGTLTLIARQLSADWDMDCLRFSPFEHLNLVTCGRENIRFWRIKEAGWSGRTEVANIPGCNVVLNSLARQSHFTSIAFEFNKMSPSYFMGEYVAEHLRVFVSTADGKLLQLHYRTRKVQAVYQLHNEAITWMCANEGFVVTASADQFVRVWPLDFQSFYLHAHFESPVIGVDITTDGLKVLCSTADGSVGVLDMQSHQYQDVLRCHRSSVADAAVSENFKELATVCCDGTLKVWSLPSMLQTHEFAIPDDQPQAVAFHPGQRHLIAVGFESGTLRIFDVDGPALLFERRHHVQPIVSLVFAAEAGGEPRADGQETEAAPVLAEVITSDSSGALAVFSEARDFEVTRCPEVQLCAPPAGRCTSLVCAPPRLLQHLDARSVALMKLRGLEAVRKLRVPAAICSMSFSVHGCFIALGTVDSRLHVFEAVNGCPAFTCFLPSGSASSALLSELMDVPGSLSFLLLAATEDKLLRVSRLTASGDAMDAVVRSACTGKVIASQEVEEAELEMEQCFLGHATAPHRIFYSQGQIATASPSEVMLWDVSSSSVDAMTAFPGLEVFAERLNRAAPIADADPGASEEGAAAAGTEEETSAVDASKGPETEPGQREQAPGAAEEAEGADVIGTTVEEEEEEKQAVPQVSADIAEEEVEEALPAKTTSALEAISNQLGSGARICILGGTRFNGADSEDIVMAVAKMLSNDLGQGVIFLTGGMSGVQDSFAKACIAGSRIYNLLPFGIDSSYGVGVDIHAGANLEERMQIFSQLGDVYISFEGGPGVSKEANAAFARGAGVVPLIRTGGASSGMFDFPAGALSKASFASDEQWKLLANKDAPVADTARAAVEIIKRFISQVASEAPAISMFEPVAMLKGVFGASVQAGSQSFAWQASPFRLCHILGADIYVEESTTAESDAIEKDTALEPDVSLVKMLTPNAQGGDDEGHQAAASAGRARVVDLDPSGEPYLAALFAGADEWAITLCLWDLRQGRKEAGSVRTDLEVAVRQSLPSCYGRAQNLILRLLPGGTGAITAIGLSEGTATEKRGASEAQGRVDIWRFKDGSSMLWASAELAAPPLAISLLQEHGLEFAVLSAESLVLWRCDFDGPIDESADKGSDASCSHRLQFQVAEAPALWCAKAAGSLTSFCATTAHAGESEEAPGQLLIMGSAGGVLWVHDADENKPLAQLQLQVASTASASSSSVSPFADGGAEQVQGLNALACSQPLLVCGIGHTLQSFSLEELGTTGPGSAGGQVGASKVLHLDGVVKELRLHGAQEESSGLAATTANTLWYFHMADGFLVPLRSFHEAPSRSLRSSLACHKDATARDRLQTQVVASCSDDGSLRLWSRDPQQQAQVLEAARLSGKAQGPCVAVCFLQDSVLACAFLGGNVLIFQTDTLQLVSQLDVCSANSKSSQRCFRRECCQGREVAESCKGGEQLLTMEALPGAGSLLFGTSTGRLLELQLQRPGFAEAAQNLLAPSGAAICELGSHDESCADGFQLVFAGCASGRLRLWKRSSQRARAGEQRRQSAKGAAASSSSSSSSSPYPCHSLKPLKPGSASSSRKAATHSQWQSVGTVTQPAKLVRRLRHEGRCKTSHVLELLSAPPVVACFVPLTQARTLLAVCEHLAANLVLYDCKDCSMLHQVPLAPELPAVLRLHAWTQMQDATAALVLLCEDRFVLGHFHGGSGVLRLSEDSWQLPGSSSRAAAESNFTQAGRPDACLMNCWEATTGTQAAGHTCNVMVKGDAAISCWEIRC
eukprot:TRINITY_DN15043_c0_g1_i2.p1 TRINITY_DN15043_c0_g1~~TRINITY_DN15043_c0_g1_i2.p1  ORF type:complete len:1968 (+),score=448.09 TRINITY_DN15043_c0_g1_i2:92-5995(+)